MSTHSKGRKKESNSRNIRRNREMIHFDFKDDDSSSIHSQIDTEWVRSLKK
jgi:hypothetical protein